MTPSGARAALLIALLSSAAPALAQPAATPPAAETPPRVAPDPAAPQGPRTYTPADFARFAPRNAYDMLSQVPGFAIESSDTERRGLGQASGNVLINGERFSGKSTDIFTELGRISASNVARIEVVDGATLNISGLTGQVANVITLSSGLSGNFVWRPQIRAERTPARLLDGEVSINGALGGTQYTLSFRNQSRRNGNAGPEVVFTPAGDILDLRDEVLFVDEDGPRLSGSIRRTFGNGSILNANAAFGFFNLDLGESSLRSGPNQPDRVRVLRERERE
jgi:outer membrane receptor for ferrienterochelin and colicins